MDQGLFMTINTILYIWLYYIIYTCKVMMVPVGCIKFEKYFVYHKKLPENKYQSKDGVVNGC